MEPVVLSLESAMNVAGGAVSLSFELPRFGISLLELGSGAGKQGSPNSDASCSCQLPAASGTQSSALLAFPLAVAFNRRRRRLNAMQQEMSQ
jgi:hypothetical protein